jgi:hypothetical protein
MRKLNEMAGTSPAMTIYSGGTYSAATAVGR